MDHQITQDEEVGSSLHLVPSPQSEAVAHDFEELTLQSVQQLPPLKERKNVLQLRLQQRRTREQLVDQGIMPPLKSPAAFHEQIKSLERARTENFLKHKIRSRPERSELVRMHILEETRMVYNEDIPSQTQSCPIPPIKTMWCYEETLAEPSLQATQMKLKRARLADDLNEKIAQRPGPMELVVKNILPVDSSVKEAIQGEDDLTENTDAFSFDEDSSDALSPEQPASQESQGSAASPGEVKISESASPISNTKILSPVINSAVPEFFKPALTPDPPTRAAVPNVILKPGPALVKQSQPKNSNEKSRSKKSKEPKPRVKKLKYHQYIPPDQKGEKNEPEMDSNYARLLQQQQLFLQLQILSQQQQHYNYQTILPAPLKLTKTMESEDPPGQSIQFVSNQSGPCTISQWSENSKLPWMRSLNDKPNNGNTATNNVNNNTASVQNTVSRQNNVQFKKAGPLPSNLDDMKVAELKLELKIRGLPVSGTKTDLIERLKPYQDLNNNGVTANTSAPVATTATTASTGSGATEDATITFTAATFSSSAQNMNIETASSTNGSSQASVDAMNSPLPMSPTPSEQSNFSTEDTNMTDTFAEIMTMMSPSQFMNASPIRVGINEDSIGATSVGTTNMDLDAAEKDRKLQEKEKQIEELKRKLEQEQKLVEVLKMQLEVEKRGQQQPCSNILVNVDHQKHFSANIKEENSMSDCQNSTPAILSGHLIGQPTVTTGGQSILANNAVVIKHEVPNPEHQNIIQQFYVTSQRPQQGVVAQSQALLTTPTAQILLPVSIKTTNAMQLSVVQPQPASTAQPPVLTTTAATLVQAPSSSQKPSAPAAQDKFTTHALNKNQQTRKVCAPTTSNNVFSYPQNPPTKVSPLFNASVSTSPQQTRPQQAAPVQNGPSPVQESNSTSPSQQYAVRHSLFNNSSAKSKDPPRYEEAIKQVMNAHSQQMDDLFDILIKSGGERGSTQQTPVTWLNQGKNHCDWLENFNWTADKISPLVKEEPSPISKMRPATASVTTMPVNTVVSRPPPQIHVAPPLSLEPTNSLSISLESQLEAFLDGTLPSGANIPHLDSHSDGRDTFSLIDDLNNDLLQHHSILDHDQTPMETTETPFTANSCLSLDLQDTNLDNMEWLDITMPNSASSLTPLGSNIQSMFSTDFLDTNDLQLQWE
ncbi:myocardin-related transcription factor B isoform X5 [Rana temporaria]|uniref:myocardin-related transcription factor B isoform X5 n=1 Tax=Rana temporaria TaxID=8407 RepID=UPI001AAD7DB5|nr:myocardin-related transcription factor B isoform X5 [Rana temporaria]XP_040212814.1 myocardin-related transcription factor B isoform X5 [Rana temporaria]